LADPVDDPNRPQFPDRMFVILRQFEQWFLGLSPSDGQGAAISLAPTWTLSVFVLVGLLLGVVTLILLLYLTENSTAGRASRLSLAIIRLLAIGLVVFMLYGWILQRHRTELADLVLILDDSTSMNLTDQYDDSNFAAAIRRRVVRANFGDPTRLHTAQTLLLENNASLLSELRRRFNLRVYTVGSAAQPLSSDIRQITPALRMLKAQETASRLGDGLRQVLQAQRGRPTSAMLLFTDGVTTEGRLLSDAALEAHRQGIPLFCVGLGSNRPPRDLRLANLLTEEEAFVGDLVHFDFELVATGFTGAATVRLSQIPGPSEGPATEGSPPQSPVLLKESQIQLDTKATSQTIHLTHRVDKSGQFEYSIEVLPREGEFNLDNNRLSCKVTVREQEIRVLLVQAYPSFEFRFLQHALVRELNANPSSEDAAVYVHTVLQEADPDYVESDKSALRTFPVSRDELLRYDVVIFGDVNPALLSRTALNNLYEFVTVRGGSIVFIAGPRYMPLAFRGTPLAPLLPFDARSVSVPDPAQLITESFRPRLTPLGLSNPITQLADTPTANEKLWRDELAPLRWFVTISNLRAGVRVLAEHPAIQADESSAPLICLQFVGAGKVLFHATDETHRWRFRVGDVYFARYWVQAIRYLCRPKPPSGQLAELSTDRDEYRQGEEVGLRVRFLDDRLAPPQDNGVTVVLAVQSGQRRSLILHRRAAERGIFETALGDLPSGTYRASLAVPSLPGEPPAHQFSILAPPGELVRTEMDAAQLREAAEISGGKFYTFATIGSLLSDLPRGRQVRIESLPPVPIWNAPLIALIFVLLLTAEWLLRKRLGIL
jgi:hypothetical protein